MEQDLSCLQFTNSDANSQQWITNSYSFSFSTVSFRLIPPNKLIYPWSIKKQYISSNHSSVCVLWSLQNTVLTYCVCSVLCEFSPNFFDVSVLKFVYIFNLQMSSEFSSSVFYTYCPPYKPVNELPQILCTSYLFHEKETV